MKNYLINEYIVCVCVYVSVRLKKQKTHTKKYKLCGENGFEFRAQQHTALSNLMKSSNVCLFWIN